MIPDIKKILAESAPVLAKAQEEVLGEDFSVEDTTIKGIFYNDWIKLSSQDVIEAGTEITRIKTGVLYEALTHEHIGREGVFAFQKLYVKSKDNQKES